MRRAGALVLIAAAIVGCQAPARDPAPAEQPSVSYADIVAAHQQRLARLPIVYAMGIVTLSRQDGPSDQGNIEWWAIPPDRLALRIYKAAIGEEFLRAGADARRAWVLDLRDKQKVMYVQRPDAALGDQERLPLMIGPAALWDLLVLTPLPFSPDTPPPPIDLDKNVDAWVFSTHRSSGLVTTWFDRKTLLPVRVELRLSSTGDVIRSDMPIAEQQSIERDGVSAAEYARWPMRILVTDAGRPGNSVSISFNEATARKSDGRFIEKVFDPQRLIRQFDPRVEGDAELLNAPADSGPASKP